MVQQIRINRLSLRYPPRIELGSLQLLSSPQMYGNQIKMFCETVKGERPLLPDWGLPRLVHKPDITTGELSAIIRSNLEKYFPSFQFEITTKIVQGSYPGHKEVDIKYYFPPNQGIVTIQL